MSIDLGQPVLRANSQFAQPGTCLHVAVGSNATRYSVHQRLIVAGCVPIAVVHPSVAARAVIAPAAKIGIRSIVNHGAYIDNECAEDNFCFIAPGASRPDGMTLGRHIFVGAGATCASWDLHR